VRCGPQSSGLTLWAQKVRNRPAWDPAPECRSRLRQRLRGESAWEEVVGAHCAMRAALVQGNGAAAYAALEAAVMPFNKVMRHTLGTGALCLASALQPPDLGARSLSSRIMHASSASGVRGAGGVRSGAASVRSCSARRQARGWSSRCPGARALRRGGRRGRLGPGAPGQADVPGERRRAPQDVLQLRDAGGGCAPGPPGAPAGTCSADVRRLNSMSNTFMY